MYPRPWLGLFAVVSLLALSVPAAAAAADPLADAVEQLGSPDPDVRDEATRLLWNAGPGAEPALRRAAEGGDGIEPEVAARARLLLEKIESGIRPDTPQKALDLVLRYKTSPVSDIRVAAARGLIELGDPAAPVLLRLWAREIDPNIKSRVLQEMRSSAPRYARLLLAGGDDATAAQLLEATALFQGGPAVVDYAAYLAARGQLKRSITEWTAADAGPAREQRRRVLGWLHLADGDFAGALDLSHQTADDTLRQTALYAAGDWKGLTSSGAIAGAAAGGEPLNAMNLRAALAHLAGDDRQLDEGLRQLRRFVEEKPRYAFICAETFFAVGRPDEAVELLAPREPATAFAFLCFRLRFDDAFALSDRALASGGKGAAWLHLGVARQQAALGEKDKAQAALTAALAAAAAEGPQALAQVNGAAVEIEEASGLHEKAIERALGTSDETARAALVAKVFPARAASARFWWRALRSRAEFRDEPPRASLDRLAALLARKLPAEQVQSCCAAAAESVLADRDIYARRQGLGEIFETLRGYGLEGPAVELLERAARFSGSAADALLRLGDVSVDAGRFVEAADYYQRARTVCAPGQPEGAVATYLQGWALAKAGRAEEAQPVLELARALPLGGEAARAALCDGLEQRGLKEEAAAEGALLMRLHGVWSLYAADAARRAAGQAAERRDFAAAAEMLGRSLLGVVRQESGFNRQEGYLAVPRAAETYRALASLERTPHEPANADHAGAADAVADTLCRLVSVFPADTEWAIRCVAELDRHDRRDLGDRLFRENAKLLEAVCDRYPAAAIYHNSLAWLAARCGRDLDGAFVHAKRAVELMPSSAACLDTLAEAHFRRGEKAAAIDCMKKCLDLEPGSAYFQQQMKRFESGG